jgi:hypothetical protein
MEAVEPHIACLPKSSPDIAHFPLVPIVGLSFLVPIVPLWLTRKILEGYRTACGEVGYFSKKGISGGLTRYAPLLLAYGVFWLAFSLAELI